MEFIESAHLSVEGMYCPNCEASIIQTVGSLHGVKNVQASTRERNVIVSFDHNKQRIGYIRIVIEDLGFKVHRSF
jgi:copper chaperone CopZ